MNLAFRSISDVDREFLSRVYASTREQEKELFGWEDKEWQDFVRHQFSLQHKYYQQQFSDAAYKIILLDNEPVGRLYVDRRKDEVHIIDIALLPEFRNRGIGSKILKDLVAEAEEENLPVRIYVEHFNPALRLYERLGFTQIDDTGVYFLMERSPKKDL
ncbi:MAG: GNAT family N-acetyltransferase [Candidatus Aminicenantes bacterium]|nr:GNAT family N-acetyltransferase [Candidatus Aminicenantes bacterium]